MNTISTGPIPNLNSKKSIWMRNSIQGLSTLLYPRSSRLFGLRAKDSQDVPIDWGTTQKTIKNILDVSRRIRSKQKKFRLTLG